MKVLFEVFEKLAKEKWTGEVQVSSSQGNAFVVLHEGEFLYAYRPFDRALERFQKITWLQIPQDVRIDHCNSWEEVLKLLLRANPNDTEKLVRHLKTDRLELFFRIFFWTNVELFPRPYSFDPNKSPELNFYGPRSLEKILREAKQRLQEWPRIQKRIGSSKRMFISKVPIKTTGAQKKPDLIDKALTDFDPQSKLIDEIGPYTEDQMQILQLCDGRHSVQDIIRKSPDGEFLVLRRLIELWDRDLLAPKEDDTAYEPLMGNSKRRFWFESFQVLVLLMLLAGFFAFHHSWDSGLYRNPSELSQLQSALEIYRSVHGVYPSHLGQMKSFGLLKSNAWDQVDYQLLGPRSYRINYRN